MVMHIVRARECPGRVVAKVRHGRMVAPPSEHPRRFAAPAGNDNARTIAWIRRKKGTRRILGI